jgi:DNA-binding transcriptional regulator PaaX
MARRIDWGEMLELFCWGLDKLSRPTLRNLLGDFDHEEERVLAPYFWRRLEQQKLATRTGRGAKAVFTITPKGRALCAEPDLPTFWDRTWDKRWRLVTFDIPEARRKDRLTLRRELRALKLGLLQRSVWVSARDVESDLHDIIRASGIPECFAVFESDRVILCTNEEVVRTAWDFEEIKSGQERYLKKLEAFRKEMTAATNPRSLFREVRAERFEYQAAMESDPLLPRELWPSGYVGEKALRGHRAFRTEARARFQRWVEQNVRIS